MIKGGYDGSICAVIPCAVPSSAAYFGSQGKILPVTLLKGFFGLTYAASSFSLSPDAFAVCGVYSREW